MRTVTYRLVDLQHTTICIGFEGENECTRIIFDAKKAFEEYPNAIPSLSVTPPVGDPYPAVVTRDGDYVYWDIVDSDVAARGSGEGQLTFVEGTVVKKSYSFLTKVNRSIVPSGSAPSAINDWITRANAALGAIPQTIADALAAAKASGEFDGEDGVGIQSIEKTGTSGLVDTYTITLTDGRTYTYTVTNGAKGNDGDDGVGIQSIAKTATVGLVDTYTVTYTNGQTTTFTVTNGAPGDDGYSPSASVSKSGKVTTVTITDKNGTTTAEIHDGEDGSNIIDDTAGVGDTDKTFSANKLATDHSSLLNALTQSRENTSIAILAHSAGDLFWYNGTLHVATSAIAVGDTIVDTGTGANCKDTTISEALIKDIQINGTSILVNGVANVPIGTNDTFGVVRSRINYGTEYFDNYLVVSPASNGELKSGQFWRKPVGSGSIAGAAFWGLAKAAGDTSQASSSNAVGAYTEDAKSSISQMLNGAVQVTGTTPSITAKAGILYVCGECATLNITAPASGEFGVIFDSGSTATVLTTTGITFQETFTPGANKHYEINVLNGYALIAEWDVSV